MRKLVTLITLAPTLAFAQVPQKLGYQGRLLQANGTPEAGTIAVTFSLWDSATGGTSLWSEIQNVAMSNGFYSVYLGDATSLAANAINGSERLLEISVG